MQFLESADSCRSHSILSLNPVSMIAAIILQHRGLPRRVEMTIRHIDQHIDTHVYMAAL